MHFPENAQKAYDITVKMPNVHGAPVQMGNPEEVGVMDVMKPDYGEAVDIYEGEIPVFWPCGVTPQAAIENAKLPIVITHSKFSIASKVLRKRIKIFIFTFF